MESQDIASPSGLETEEKTNKTIDAGVPDEFTAAAASAGITDRHCRQNGNEFSFGTRYSVRRSCNS